MTPGRRSSAPSAAPLVAVAILLGAVVSLVVTGAMFLQGWKAVPVDKVALHYSGGPIQGQHFEQVVGPGTRTRFYGLLERLHELPATQRNYVMSKHPGQGDTRRPEYVGAPAADKVLTEWESATYFKLNTRPEVVRGFFEQICLKYRCTDLRPGGGWDRMLDDTFRQQIVAAIQEVARQYSSEDIYASRHTLVKMQTTIGSTLKQRVRNVLGGEYFCGPTFRPEAPDCPEFAFRHQGAHPSFERSGPVQRQPGRGPGRREGSLRGPEPGRPECGARAQRRPTCLPPRPSRAGVRSPTQLRARHRQRPGVGRGDPGNRS